MLSCATIFEDIELEQIKGISNVKSSLYIINILKLSVSGSRGVGLSFRNC